MIISNFIFVKCENGETQFIPLDTNKDKFFYEVSRRIAFADCSGEEIEAIYFDNCPVKYEGWQPNMVFEYKDLEGNTVWVGQFEEWDH